MPPGLYFTNDQFLQLLDPTDDPKTDAESTLRLARLMKDGAIAYAHGLRLNPQFIDWLSSEQPRLILVDGCCAREGTRSASPMSVFTASLASCLFQEEASVVVQFFCGYHLDQRSMHPGPAGLLRSVTSQLLMYLESDELELGPIDPSLYDAVLEDDTIALCTLFENIFWQVEPHNTVYVLIDGLNAYESRLLGFEEGVSCVFEMFRRLERSVLEGWAPGPTLKLLIANPGRSQVVVRHVNGRTEYVRLSDRNLSDNGRLGWDLGQLVSMRRARSPQAPLPY